LKPTPPLLSVGRSALKPYPGLKLARQTGA
jgi:hypothetical protein